MSALHTVGPRRHSFLGRVSSVSDLVTDGAVEIDVDVAHAHLAGIDDQLVDLADLLSTRSDHIPSANVGIAIGNLVVVELVEPTESVVSCVAGRIAECA